MKLKCEAEDMIDNSHLITMISMFVRYAEENENKHNQIPYSIENKEERHLDWFAKFLTIAFLFMTVLGAIVFVFLIISLIILIL